MPAVLDDDAGSSPRVRGTPAFYEYLREAINKGEPIRDLSAYAGKLWDDSMRERMAGSTATA